MKSKRPIYLVQTQPGFEQIAVEEISALHPAANILGTRSVSTKNGLVLFEYPGDVHDLLQLRTIEDLFVLISHMHDLPASYSGLHLLRDCARTAELDAAIGLARAVKPRRGGQGRLRFRVVARQVGRVDYRRVDAQMAIERGISARTDHRWRLEEEGALEFWLTLLPGEVLLALRLTDEHMRHRDLERTHLPASLRPSAAAALVWLTQPQPDDVFLDPMCGAGTILIERAMAERYALLLGGDLHQEAVAATLANIGPRYKPISVRLWDARQLPVDAGSISAAAVNLPFGKQIGSADSNRALYPAVFQEMARVIRSGGRMVALTGDLVAMEQAARQNSAFKRQASYQVELLGQRARIYVLTRT